MTLRYAGAPCFLTPCEWLGDMVACDPCNNGQCQGKIEGECPFRSEERINPRYQGFFEDVE